MGAQRVDQQTTTPTTPRRLTLQSETSYLWRVVYRVHWTDSTARTWCGYAGNSSEAKHLAIAAAKRDWPDHSFAVISITQVA